MAEFTAEIAEKRKGTFTTEDTGGKEESISPQRTRRAQREEKEEFQ
jgi:hypothetical protein